MERTTPPKQQFGLPDIGIPAEILFHPKLTNTEKMLYGFIRNLAHSEKGCYASNNWLSGLLGVKSQTVSNGLANLRKWEIILIEYIKCDGKDERRIYLNPEYPQIYNQMLTEEGYKKINIALLKNLYTPIKKFIHPYKKFNSPLNIKKDIKDDSKKDSLMKTSSNGQITASQFEDFWNLYPKKAGKGDALTRWNTICNKPPKERPTWRIIKKAILQQKKTDQWQKPKFIPNASTWLNQSKWLNDPKEMKSYNREEEKPKFIIEYGERWELGEDGKYRDSEGIVLMQN